MLKPFGDQQSGDHVVDIQRFDEQSGAAAEFFLPALAFLGLGQDVDIPAGQLAGQPHVLAAAADGEAELLVRHHHFDPPGFLVQHDLGHLGGRQSVDDEGRGLRAPGNDVDFFALQFLHDGLHARAAHADAGADRVDRAVAADHRHLRARAGIARHRLDLDDAVVDFRHLLREQFSQEAGMGAAERKICGPRGSSRTS